VVIVGAGPAGLAAALAVASVSKFLSVTIVDCGLSLSERVIDGSIAGFGGASLCNDGKLSWGAAGSALRYLPENEV
jgi:flavin-dependent dehydrogenase